MQKKYFERVYQNSTSTKLRNRLNVAKLYNNSHTVDVGHSKFYFSSNVKKGVYRKISFLGAGKMAEAMISPLIDAGIQPATDISILDVSQKTMDHSQVYPGVQPSQDLNQLLDRTDLLVLAVKPQNLSKIFQDLQRHIPNSNNNHNDITLLSIVAGKPIQTLVDGTGIAKVARSMPNTPAQIGKGVTVWSCTQPNIDAQERNKIKKVLDSFGKSIYVEDESFIDMSTSISGSGPAYVFMLMEAMVDAGVHMGFSRETATTLVHHTLMGSTLYAMETGQHPAILRNSVTSPAGTTASAIYELEKGKFRTVVKDAIWACYRRSLEMGGADSNVGPGRISYNWNNNDPQNVHANNNDANTNKPNVCQKSTKIDPSNEHHPVEAPAGEMTDLSLDDNENEKTK